MKRLKRLLSLALFLLLSQINYAQTPEFYFNGAADVIFRFPPRGAGGRALVHDTDNVFSLNYGGDFTGGTRIGNGFRIANNGSFSAFDRLFLSTDGNLGIGTFDPEVPLTVYGKSHFYPSRVGTGDARCLSVDNELTSMNFMNNDYPIVFKTGGGNQPLIFNAARVGIGTINPQEMLSVNGNIRAREIKVEAANWPDYVFEKEYILPTLKETKCYIEQHGHLPDMPSAKVVAKEGQNLGEIQAKLLKKVEELTLHLIRLEEADLKQKKHIDEQDKIIKNLKKSVKK
ncbi:hypothetical protein OQX63_00075 [Pedobacter sp. PF22-3]|uniref:hypothetical protein n=1 Tax=Pedobacter sp. PF22-3 TaxID=2994467 RepID=UPI0022473BF4|nr:hypothetical protein [Pedobacter sp. PF22-3]MCX2491846.1 hypothetical protein [Pedobacter sp. PF22-3]